MQRVIKFRAKKKTKFGAESKTDGQWVFGDLITRPIHHECCILENGCINHSVDPNTVGQFTGLLDELTKQGYEGDIIERDASDGNGKVRGLIVFEEGQFRVNWFDKNKGWNNSLYLHLSDSRIIGNKFDNPAIEATQSEVSKVN